jgi:hypothetical protein
MRQSNGRVIGAFILIIVGVIALLENSGVLHQGVIKDFLRYAVKWWPLLLIFIGVRMLMGGDTKGRD